jgi:hypothetical protein
MERAGMMGVIELTAAERCALRIIAKDGAAGQAGIRWSGW